MALGAYRQRCALVAVAALLLAIAFFTGGYFVPRLVHKTLKSMICSSGSLLLDQKAVHSLFIAARLAESVIVDSENSTTFSIWQDTNAEGAPPMYMNFHVWNITNPDEWLAGAKPILEDIGPYAYKQSRVKLNVTFEQNGTIARYWLWVRIQESLMIIASLLFELSITRFFICLYSVSEMCDPVTSLTHSAEVLQLYARGLWC